MDNLIPDITTKIESIRTKLSAIREEINQINASLIKAPKHYDNITHIAEGITCYIHLLYCINENLHSLQQDEEDHIMSPGIYFDSRGIGLDSGDFCIFCGKKQNKYYNNISGFVKSKLAGEAIVELFNNHKDTWYGGAWLDYRKHEPSWIQVKITACDDHLPNLKKLNKQISKFNLIRSEYIDNAINLN